jgi:DUF4097 and DUF4098 domain-containing protein YvlB
MNSLQRVIKYCAIALAVILAVGIISAIVNLVFGIVSFSSGRVTVGNHFTARSHMSKKDWDTIDFDQTFSDVKSLNIDNSTGVLKIETGDTFRVEAEDVLEGFKAEVKNDGELYVTDNDSDIRFFGFHFNGINNPNSKITIYVPEDFNAEEIKIESGAGTVSIDRLNTDYLYILAGAGNINADSITASEVKMDGGVGSVNFNDVNFTDADFSCGVGGVNVSGVMLGDNKFDCGVGSVDLNLTGDIADYDLDIDSGVGNIRVNGDKVRESELRNRSAANSIEVEGGVGDVNIDIN